MQAMPAAIVSSGTRSRLGLLRNPHQTTLASTLIFACLIPSSLPAQPPAIQPVGIANAAGRKPLNYPGGALSPGARFRIDGYRFSLGTGKAQLLWDGKAISVLSVSDNTIEALVPTATQPGIHRVAVFNSEGRTKDHLVPVVASAPGIYSANGLGWGPIDPTLKTQPGGSLTIKITGLGLAGAQVSVANLRAKVLRQNTSSVEIQIPNNTPPGCSVPVAIGDSNVVTITVGDPAKVCAASDSRLPVTSTSTRIGLAAASRIAHWSTASVEPILSDEFLLAFRDGGFSGYPVLLTPPTGSCTLYTGPVREGLLGENNIPKLILSALTGTPIQPLSSLKLSSGGRSIDLAFPGSLPGALLARVGLRDPANPRTRPLFFNSPSIQLDYGGLSLATPEPLLWTNRKAFHSLHLNSRLNFAWSGLEPKGEVYLLLGASDPTAATSAIALCTASALAQTFTIPDGVFRQLVPINTPAANMKVFAAILRLKVDMAEPPPGGLAQMWRLAAAASSTVVSLR